MVLRKNANEEIRVENLSWSPASSELAYNLLIYKEIK